ncbi:MAG TPA: cytochrome c biogenesis heme-transporting ATPase CcmA [Woeseiaceae bacterium]|nr:cytochrome c biogenesis heme-transporting ATPase CcmA [Woeseiaceae bacterium]
MTHTLTADDLLLIRGERCLFANLSFTVNAGELLLLEGRNGSGKTSLLKTVAGILEPEAGEVRWNGEPVRMQRQAFLAATAWLGHRIGFKSDLTAIENLRFEASLRPVRTRDIEEALERLGVLRLKKQPLRALSAGQQRRVAFARMLLAAAPLWLLDEPFTNLDRDGRALVTELVAEHVSDGGLCLLAAHQDVAVDVPTQRIQLQ